MNPVPFPRERSLVVFNPASRHGAGAARWRRVRETVAERFDVEVVETDEQSHWSAQVGAALDAGVRNFIAAGGDGTVNALLNALAGATRAVPLREVTLGAVGLGSSNDFHKPFAETVQGVPLRLGAAAARDVGRARYVDDAGVARERLFLVSASIGITATANAFFNCGDWVLRNLKARWVGGAITYAALRTIAVCPGVQATLRMPGGELRTGLANLSVMKSPFLSGSFKYDTPVDPASGLFAINLCEDLGRCALLRTLFHLARGRFLSRTGTRHAMLPELEVVPARPIDLELDGEVVRARRVRFDLLPAGIRVCR